MKYPMVAINEERRGNSHHITSLSSQFKDMELRLENRCGLLELLQAVGCGKQLLFRGLGVELLL